MGDKESIKRNKDKSSLKRYKIDTFMVKSQMNNNRNEKGTVLQSHSCRCTFLSKTLAEKIHNLSTFRKSI